MAKGHRSQIKRERNAVKDTRPSAKLSYARVPVQKACFVLDAIRGKNVGEAFGTILLYPFIIIDVPLSFVGDTLMLPVKGIQKLSQD